MKICALRNVALALSLSLSIAGCVSEKNSSEMTTQISTPKPEAPSEPDEDSRNLPGAFLNLNGKNLEGWQMTDIGGRGAVTVQNGEIKLEMGAELSGINWTNAAVLPKTNYEIELDAMKLDGYDFFCGLTFPVSNSFCSLIVGGWGGGIVGLSSVNGADASENDTTRNLYFEKNRWFHIRVRVTPEKIMAWIDKDAVVELDLAGRRIATRGGEIDSFIPLGIATWQTTAVVKNIRMKKI